jgi:signal transduction histidine kinase
LAGVRLHVLLHDLAPALLLAAFTCAVTPLADDSVGAPPLDAGAYALCVAAGLSFAVRRRAPVFAYAAAIACVAAFAILYQGGPIFVCALAAMLWLVAAKPRRVWVPLVLAGMLVFGVAHVIEEELDFGIVVIGAVWLGTAGLFGEVVRSKRAGESEARARVQLAESRREEETMRRLAEERLRIAREVHDVVGHGLAAISLQAGVAEHLLDARPEEARRSLAAIRQVSRTALDELRAEIGALRGDDDPAPRVPTPGLEALPRLVHAMRGAGLDVDVDVDLGAARAAGVPDAVQAAGYRIVQEALTNVARHAGAHVHADVRVVCGSAGLELEVVDDGAGRAAAASEGNGLPGMRERAAALGGRFEAGPTPGRGFRVWALLPGAHS